jgi:flagellar hook-associated protein 3 FlgL
MRITEGMRYQTLLQDIERAQERNLKAQQQVSSGKRVSSPSDDPVAALNIVKLSSDRSESDQYLSNLTFAKSKLQLTDGVLDTVQRLVERALTLGQLSFESTTVSNAYVPEVNGLRDQLISAANTTYAGRFIFGGSVTTTPPYVKNADSSVTYNGNAEDVPLEISRTSTVETQIAGSDLFSGALNIFDILSDLAAAMQSWDKPAIDAQIKKLEQFTDVVSTARTKVGGSLNFTSDVEDTLKSASLAREAQLSQVEAADLATAISELTMSQNGLQAALAVGARVSQVSILDYLR